MGIISPHVLIFLSKEYLLKSFVNIDFLEMVHSTQLPKF